MNPARWRVSEENPAPSGSGKPSVLQLSRIPIWMLRAGLSSLGFWLILALLGNTRGHSTAADWVLEFEPVLLGLGVAFTLYGTAFHLAINMAHWREVRDDDHEAQVMLSGRKRFERRKDLRVGHRSRRQEATEKKTGVFDALD